MTAVYVATTTLNLPCCSLPRRPLFIVVYNLFFFYTLSQPCYAMLLTPPPGTETRLISIFWSAELDARLHIESLKEKRHQTEASSLSFVFPAPPLPHFNSLCPPSCRTPPRALPALASFTPLPHPSRSSLRRRHFLPQFPTPPPPSPPPLGSPPLPFHCTPPFILHSFFCVPPSLPPPLPSPVHAHPSF